MVLPLRGLALVFLSAVLCASATAQIPGFSSVPSFPRVSGSAADIGVLALEGAVDESTYLVGPGDVFVVAIGGSASRQFTATVSADGRLVIPEAGAFRAAGRTLASVRAEAGAALRRQFSRVTTDIALASPRQFTVHVSGVVPQPGRRVVRATARVEDAIAAAFETSGATLNATERLDLDGYTDVLQPGTDIRPAYRNVRVSHTDGTADRVDLARYLMTGDVEHNPYLFDGDAVHVPTFSPAAEGVFLSGAVRRRGAYDTYPGDTALNLLTVATGEDPVRSIRAVRITRIDASGAPVVVEVPIAEAQSFALAPRDQVFAISATPLAGTAAIVGAVRYPGTYAITSGETTLDQLVELGGGLSPEALARGMYLERRAQTGPEELRDEAGSNATTLTTAPDVARFDSVSLELGTLSDLTFVERRLFLQNTYRTPRLSLDVNAALEAGQSIPLLDGDRLVVPSDLGLVRVYGQVARPGFVPFQEGLSADAYVGAVGGLAPAATATYVIDASTGLFTPGGIVQAGDAVYVAREATSDSPQLESLAIQQRSILVQEGQLANQERSIRQQARFQFYQVAISSVTTLVSVILLVNQLTSN